MDSMYNTLFSFGSYRTMVSKFYCLNNGGLHLPNPFHLRAEQLFERLDHCHLLCYPAPPLFQNLEFGPCQHLHNCPSCMDTPSPVFRRSEMLQNYSVTGRVRCGDTSRAH